MPPKTIFGSSPAKPVIEPSVKQMNPSVLFSGTVISKAERVMKPDPSPLFGHDSIVRNRININISDLRAAYPKVNEVVLSKSIELILTTNCERITQNQIVNWGYSAQEKYTDLVEQIATVNASPLIAATKSLINEIGELIETDTKTAGFIKKYLSKKTTESVYRRIVVKNELLKKNTVMLNSLLEVIGNHINNTVALEQEISIHVISGNVISKYIPDTYKDTIGNRLVSLESLDLQFRMSKKQLELLNETVIRIISIIQDTLSVEVPTWYNNKTFQSISEVQKQEILKKIKI